jgi:hypothetical protein
MFEGLQQALVEYRRWVEEEEKVMADPVKHQQFKQVRGGIMPPATIPTPFVSRSAIADQHTTVWKAVLGSMHWLRAKAVAGQVCDALACSVLHANSVQ